MGIIADLQKYSDDCISDKIPSCKKHKWACQRFLTDINNQRKSYFPFLFSEDNAERYFKWMRLFKHTKGALAGQYKEPELFEMFFFGQIYGWVDGNNIRRYRHAYLQIARKNAKSQDLAIMAPYELSAFGEPCPEVYIAATQKEQTKYVWEETQLMISQSEILRDKFKTSYGIITHIKSGGKFIRLSKEDKKKGDGGNPQCGIIDEYHAHPTTDYIDLISSGMKTRKQPILIIITTAGFDLTFPCYIQEYQYISSILNPNSPIKNEDYLADVFELDKDEHGNLIDDINDEKVWLKPNPIVGKTDEGKKSILSELKTAIDKPAKMRDFLTKTMNVWVSMPESGYIDFEKWKLCKGEIPNLNNKTCFVGIDLSSKISLTSLTFEFPIDDMYYIISHSFMPSESVAKREHEDKVPYGLWIRQGWITQIEGPVIDYKKVYEYIKLYQEKCGFYIEEICIDPWGMQQINQLAQEDGYTIVEITQGIRTLSEPTKDFLNMVLLKRIVHDGSPVLQQACGSAIIEIIDRNENIMLSKKKSRSRIDPISATINAHVRAMIYKENSPRVIFI